MEHTHEELCGILNGQTGQVNWSELQRHFAQGLVIKVSTELDLIETAATIIEDDGAQVEQWMSQGKVSKVSDEDAIAWQHNDAELWSVVAAPWVLVQEQVGAKQ